MQALGNINVKKWFSNDGWVGQFKQVRNIFIKEVEYTFFVLSLVLGLLGWILFGCGLKFLGTDLVTNGHFSFERLKGAMVLFLIFYLFFLNGLAVVGGCISMKRDCFQSIILIFSLVIFFFGAIPILAEGNSLLSFTTITDERVNQLCSDDYSLKKESKWTQWMIQSGKEFDAMSEQLLNQNMCTETCPCFEYNTEQMEDNPMLAYEQHLEIELNKYGRTNYNYTWATNKGMVPLLWTKDSTFGFKSFMACYQYWEKKAEKDPKINLAEKFKLNEYMVGQNYMKPFQNPRESKKDVIPQVPSNSYLLSHLDDYEIFQIYEDDFNCSGMCTKGIFYFSNPIHYGLPKDTCLMHFKHALEKDIKPFADTAIVTGVICILIFTLHFGMYCRPVPDSVNINKKNLQPQSNSQKDIVNQENGFRQISRNSRASTPYQDQSSIQSNSMFKERQISNGNSIEISEIKLDQSEEQSHDNSDFQTPQQKGMDQFEQSRQNVISMDQQDKV